MRIVPGDRWQCAGCGQVLAFGPDGRVPQEQLDACEGRCDWTLVEREGRSVEDGPGV